MKRCGKRQVTTASEEPTSAFAAVRYRDCWFWVDNGDLQTKRALTVVTFFFTLAEPAVQGNCR